MNYTSAAVGGIMLIALITWFTTGNKQFKGPESGGVWMDGDDGVAHAVVSQEILQGEVHPKE